MSGIETLIPAEEREAYRIRLPNFEGPLDLLLFLIRKEEMDIYDIPIALITRQYLAYIELMQELDLDIAGEFILMAATLIQIKVKMLLPKPEEEGEGEEEGDPRTELVRQLLEYKRFKEVAEDLTDLEDRQRRMFPRTYFEWQKPFKQEGREVVLKEMSLFDLLQAFKTVLDHIPEEPFHSVNAIQVTLEEQIAFIDGMLRDKQRFAFSDLMMGLKERIVIIVTFMAILEMIRTRRISVHQSSIFEEIWIVRR
ncbi:segregation/condensation protein A [bacterium]|nr:segregation/condensation protein A [bacterium]